jgi:hypothetical protein
LVTLGKQIFAVGGSGYNGYNVDVVEAFDESVGLWVPSTYPLFQPKRHLDAVAVPASLFKNLPGGCIGVLNYPVLTYPK